MRRRRRRGGRIPNKVVRKLRAALSFPHKFRYRLGTSTPQINVPANAVTSYPLLTSKDDPNYDTGGDFTTPCECETGSRITGINLRIYLGNFTTNVPLEVMIYKDPDAILGGIVDPSGLFTNDLNSSNIVLRKYAIAYRMITFDGAGRSGQTIQLRVRRKALARIARMQDLENLYMVIKNPHASQAAGFHGHGTITVRK